eukprot:15782100-Heterocapsa_arctica.AAC.1
MLLGVMLPQWTEQLATFANELRDWKLTVARYEQVTGIIVPDEVKCSVVSIGAQRATQSYFHISDRELTHDYNILRTAVSNCL